MWKEFTTTEARTKFGYPREAFYVLQPKTWMDGWMDGWVGGWMGGWVDGWMRSGS
jgi:hypothetical protein